MNLHELDRYKLSDAVKFNARLNPKLWGKDEHLKPEVRDALMKIADDFRTSLGVDNLNVKDITVSGSNAAYTYTPNSDIDLHLVVDLPEADASEVYRELFDAKKYAYNNQHNIKIGGYDVELYVQNANESPVSQGEYSLLNNNWIQVPRRQRADVVDTSTRSKYQDLKQRIKDAIKSQDYDVMAELMTKIRHLRQSGLDEHGEFGPENLAFKMLRTQGYIKQLADARTAAKDQELSIDEQVRPRVTYGFTTESKDDLQDTINQFARSCIEYLGIEKAPKLKLHTNTDWSEQTGSFGQYDPDSNVLHLATSGRHTLDILRTMAHEFTHRKQAEKETLPADAGETGSRWEDEANAMAGRIMRHWAEKHPEMFAHVPLEEASGYIPTKKQAKDPRFVMALTKDVRPGAVGKEANKLGLQTDAQGHPALLTATLNESLAAEFEAFAEGKSYGYNSTPLSQVPGEREDELGNQEATGPETPPQMPAGTTKIDVSDLTDWYRLGMDISDLDDADPEDYNQGPPQTVIVFPSDEAEQGYLKQFKRLGLKTHDMDPDVEGGEDTTGKHLNQALAEELTAFKEQDLFEVKMTSKNLAKLAKDIKDVKVGLEFEMIVPNTDDPDDQDMEPDYDQDERVRDIDDAVNFFDDGDYNSPRSLRDLRSAMEEDYQNWVIEGMDQSWYGGDGFDYFKDYLDREEPFDRDDALEEAEDYVRENNPDMEPGSDEYSEAVSKRLNEMEENYAQEQWDEQGRNFDYAREEYEEEQRDNYSEQDWLGNESIRYASDVESRYGNVTWPYYTSSSNQGEQDIENVALNFMNAMGMDSVAVSSSYHGSYKKWVGNGWVNVGSTKPDDCFSIEPDGSLEGDSDRDAGLEFVSPPIPLEDIGTVMKKVQAWAADNGVYTGKNNKTSIHTNISVPGYDIKNLDYLKAALLLGDEHVLREFDRIGNTYAKPAIEKVRQLVKSNPDKAKELLDKMKSQLNAEASKLIHSGITDKFTSINTKDNRIEFRSPGGDYLSIIADNPQKMIDTINRMVVTMDAAMDPNKYKEEYQKKLYKMLTGQGGGREAKTGAKQEMKASDKDLLNIFSRYAAGELPKAALKSFVRQAQLERKGKKADAALASHNWAIRRRDGNSIVKTFQADDYNQAFDVLQQYKQQHNITDNSLTYGPYNPSEEKPAEQGGGLYKIFDTRGTLIAGDEYGSDRAALARAGVWAMRRGVDVVVKNAQGEEIGRVSASGEITPTAQQDQGNWGIWMTNADRFANQPGTYARGETPPLYRFPSREAAEQWIEQQRAARPNMRTDIEVREIEPARQPVGDINLFPEIEPSAPIPGSTLDLQRQRAAQASEYELYRISDGRAVTAPAGNPIVFRADSPEDAESKIARYAADFNLGAPELFAVRSVLQVPAQQPGGTINTANEPTTGSAVGQTYNPSGTGSFTGQWLILNPNNQVIYRFGGIGNSQSDANRHAMNWLTQNPRQMQDGVTVVPEMG